MFGLEPWPQFGFPPQFKDGIISITPKHINIGFIFNIMVFIINKCMFGWFIGIYFPSYFPTFLVVSTGNYINSLL